MSNTAKDFLQKKKANSPYLTLADGETVDVLEVMDIKADSIPNTYKQGEMKDVLVLKCKVNTSEGVKVKEFTNGTPKFAEQIDAKGIDVGSSFSMTRDGEMAKTIYIITNVKNKGGLGAMPAPTQASTPTAPATPVTPNDKI